MFHKLKEIFFIVVNVTYTTCRFFNTYRPYSNVEYSLVWLGKDLVETDSCNIRFKPFDEDHKICIESQSFILEDCRNKMISYDGKYAYYVKKVNFEDPTPQNNEKEKENIDISIYTYIVRLLLLGT